MESFSGGAQDCERRRSILSLVVSLMQTAADETAAIDAAAIVLQMACLHTNVPAWGERERLCV